MDPEDFAKLNQIIEKYAGRHDSPSQAVRDAALLVKAYQHASERYRVQAGEWAELKAENKWLREQLEICRG